jgi:hypothetical protein
MRALILALVMAAAAGAACAQAETGEANGDVRSSLTPTVPGNARQQAEDAIRRNLSDPSGATFRNVKAVEVASIKHSAFETPVNGPVTLVCGQYSSQDRKGDDAGYAWFLVAIKRGHILWTTSDSAFGDPGQAYYSCQGAGLAK